MVSTHSGITHIIPHCVADCPPMDASKASRLKEDESVSVREFASV